MKSDAMKWCENKVSSANEKQTLEKSAFWKKQVNKEINN